jgi:excisionase family DNA binding protein
MQTESYNPAQAIGALTIGGFCARFNIGKTRLYEEIAEGRLPARKVGTKTLISVADAERWFAGLPPLPARAA